MKELSTFKLQGRNLRRTEMVGPVVRKLDSPIRRILVFSNALKLPMIIIIFIIIIIIIISKKYS